jgi:hypothetical protein
MVLILFIPVRRRPINVVTNFSVSFSIPYLLYDEYAGLQSRVGFVFEGVLALAIGFVYFCVPECREKSLEQVDALFNEGVSLRRFGRYKPDEIVADEGDKEEKGVELAGVKHEERHESSLWVTSSPGLIEARFKWS